jgi:hypothetical protein
VGARDLVDAFFRSSGEAFAFLHERGATSIQHLEVWDATDFKPVRLADLPDDVFFHAQVDYEGRGWSVRVEYGDRTYLINTVLAITDGGNRSLLSSLWNSIARQPEPASYSLWEWIETLGDDATAASHPGGADTPDRIAAGVSKMGDSLRTHLPAILRDRAILIPRVQARRDQRMREWTEKDRLDRDRRVAIEAAEAFRRSDFKRVVELLEPLEPRLTALDRKKLNYARTRQK